MASIDLTYIHTRRAELVANRNKLVAKLAECDQLQQRVHQTRAEASANINGIEGALLELEEQEKKLKAKQKR